MEKNNNPKDPRLKCRYAKGLGDLVACILHSTLLGWFTKLITGKDKPCNVCSQRADALNILVPIPFWKLFYKTPIDFSKALAADLEASGYSVAVSEDFMHIQAAKSEPISRPTQIIKNLTFASNHGPEKPPDGYKYVSSSDKQIDHVIIRTTIFKTL
jgi:hypothetical protein